MSTQTETMCLRGFSVTYSWHAQSATYLAKVSLELAPHDPVKAGKACLSAEDDSTPKHLLIEENSREIQIQNLKTQTRYALALWITFSSKKTLEQTIFLQANPYLLAYSWQFQETNTDTLVGQLSWVLAEAFSESLTQTQLSCASFSNTVTLDPGTSHVFLEDLAQNTLYPFSWRWDLFTGKTVTHELSLQTPKTPVLTALALEPTRPTYEHTLAEGDAHETWRVQSTDYYLSSPGTAWKKVAYPAALLNANYLSPSVMNTQASASYSKALTPPTMEDDFPLNQLTEAAKHTAKTTAITHFVRQTGDIVHQHLGTTELQVQLNTQVTHTKTHTHQERHSEKRRQLYLGNLYTQTQQNYRKESTCEHGEIGECQQNHAEAVHHLKYCLETIAHRHITANTYEHNSVERTLSYARIDLTATSIHLG